MINELLKSFITLFVIMDPFASLPIFLSLTRGMPKKKVVSNANSAIAVASLLLFLFLFFGVGIFKFFNISLHGFLIAGGIILMVIGMRHVLGLKFREDISKYDAASVPIGTPLITGPGVITTTMILVNEFGMLITAIAAVASLASVWIILRYSTFFYRIIGDHWTKVMSRVMGILLAAIAVEFVRKGVLGMMGLL